MKISIKEYAELKGITTAGVYKAIREGRLETVIEGNIKYIVTPDQEKEKEPLQAIETLINEVEYLKELLKRETEARVRAEKDKDTLNQRLQESNIIQIKVIETLKQLEYKQEETEKELIQEKTKTWWQKLLKK